MTVSIYKSNKFNNASEQYYAEAGGYTLLRLTYSGQGGTIMTATANDDRPDAPPVYRDRKALNAAMRHSVELLGGRAEYVRCETDRKGRLFVRTDYNGTHDQLQDTLADLAEEILVQLNLATALSSDNGYNDLRDLYNDLCITEGEPVYLSDGAYLGEDGRIF